MVISLEILALMLFITDTIKINSFNGMIERPKAGEGQGGESLVIDLGREEREIYVDVSDMRRTEKEIAILLDGAKKEIDESYRGQNESLEKVSYNLNPQNSYQNGAVLASWEYDKYGLVDATGNINYDELLEDEIVQVSVSLICDGVEEIYTFPICLLAPSSSTESGFNYLLKQSLKAADESTRNEESLVLPEQVGDRLVQWKLKDGHRSIQLAIFGIVTAVVLLVANNEEKKRKIKERIKRMEADYPDIVSMLSLYVGAGISVKEAFIRISKSYLESDDKDVHPGFYGVAMLKRDMDDGKGELDAYRDFGKRMEHKNYRKLSILLCQNLRKGSSQLISQLEQEEHEAFEERKLRAKIAGEEASTKLLVPMIGLMAIVMIVLIFPAMQGINI